MAEKDKEPAQTRDGLDLNREIALDVGAAGDRSVLAGRDIVNSNVFTGDFKVTVSVPESIGSAPPYPSLFIGRDADVHELKVRLGLIGNAEPDSSVQVITAIRGWPGVGKTTLASRLAHDEDVRRRYSDGVLWTSLGTNPEPLSKLTEWGRALRTDLINTAQTPSEASARLTALLRGKRVLLMIDDVWDAETGRLFMIGGADCATILTTRSTTVAQNLALPSNIYRLGVLNEEDGLDLLNRLAPSTITNYGEDCRQLVLALDGLPLALHVAARLLTSEQDAGLNVAGLLKDLRERAMLLESKAPVGMTSIEHETTPTVAALLQKSTDHLNSQARDCFAYLGVFAPEPASFDSAALASVWQIQDPIPVIKTLVDRGLIEPMEGGRFQIHSLLALHARTYLT